MKDSILQEIIHGRECVTPFFMFEECEKRIAYCLPNEIFVLKEIADRCRPIKGL